MRKPIRYVTLVLISPSNPIRQNVSATIRTWGRHLSNWTNKKSFTRTISPCPLPFLTVEHSTPIYRNLNGVDQRLFENKKTNLKLAITNLQNIIINPGEVFSFWNLVDSPSQDRGYKEGLVISAGKPKEGIGGGLCQLSNAIFWLILHSDLSVIERHRHSFDLFPDDSRLIPFGTGATVVYNFKDLRFQNNTDAVFQLSFSLSETDLNAKLLSSEKLPHEVRIIERQHQFHQTEQGLFRSNAVFKQILDRGNPIREILLFQNHCKCRYSFAEVKV